MASVQTRRPRSRPPLRRPTEDEIKQALEATLRLDPKPGQAGEARMSTIRLTIRDEDGAESDLDVPPLALALLGQILDELARGNAVMLEPVPRLLSVPQAAELLGVSWGFVRELIEKSELTSQTDGIEPRVVFEDLMDYKKKDDAATSEALDEMVALSQELGLGLLRVPTITAVYDACVLYSAPLRDLLVELGYRRVIQARWTAEIHGEWMGNLRANRPDIDPKKLERTRVMMDRVRGSLVTGHLPLIPSLTLPDPDDRHVLAAAILCKAKIIVTKNLKDFPQDALKLYGIQAQHPDLFLLKLLNGGEEAFCSVIRAVRQRLKKPPSTVDDYLLTLEQQGLTQTVSRLRESIELL